MTRKRYNHRPQTNPRHLEEETQNTDIHAAAKHNQSKATIALFLSKMITKLEITLSTTLQNNDQTKKNKQKNTHSGSKNSK